MGKTGLDSLDDVGMEEKKVWAVKFSARVPADPALQMYVGTYL